METSSIQKPDLIVTQFKILKRIHYQTLKMVWQDHWYGRIYCIKFLILRSAHFNISILFWITFQRKKQRTHSKMLYCKLEVSLNIIFLWTKSKNATQKCSISYCKYQLKKIYQEVLKMKYLDLYNFLRKEIYKIWN